MYNTSQHERYLEHNETSTIHKMKETYWTTKQAVIKKLGKKEDVHVVASDHELDSKLEVFKAVQMSCMDLLRVIERYQDRLCGPSSSYPGDRYGLVWVADFIIHSSHLQLNDICSRGIAVIAQEENAMGRYLKSQANVDKTRAGKMMAAVGKSQSFAAQQRLALRVPLIRLYQEVETFRYRAISDTLMTINRMESARTEYRGALLWMKNISEELDPDTYKQLEKFRKVQALVRKTKGRFDRLKLDVMQKVDLLAASRCNMFSHVLANYQTALLQFWQKTSRTMNAVSESFKGYQYYEFNLLKELVEPSKKLAEETSQVSDTDIASMDDFDPEKLTLDLIREEMKSTNGVAVNKTIDDSDDELISVLSDELHRETEMSVTDGNRLIEFEEADYDDKLLNDPDLSVPMSKGRVFERENGREETIEVGSDLLEELSLRDGNPNQPVPAQANPLSGDVTTDSNDDISALIEILNDDDDDAFSKEWQEVFGPSKQMSASESADFMPSSLLDLDSQKALQPEDVLPDAIPSAPMNTTTQASKVAPAKSKKQAHKKSQKSDMSAWFNLFADLDPLSNPDAIGKKPEDIPDQA